MNVRFILGTGIYQNDLGGWWRLGSRWILKFIISILVIDFNKIKLQRHPFHLVSPSPWPVFTSFSVGSLAATAAISMHYFLNGYILFYLALMIVIMSMVLWFRDVCTEGAPENIKALIKKAATIAWWSTRCMVPARFLLFFTLAPFSWPFGPLSFFIA